jgi:Winged helix DNA-binding domain
MKAIDVAHWRMRSLRLSGDPLESPEAVVHWLGAAQSQDYGPAKWSVGERTRGAGDAALDRLFAQGAILRTHVLRPTWHFVTPADIRWLLELTGPRVHALNAHYYRQLGLDDDVLEKSSAAIAGALGDGACLTRKEISDALKSVGIVADAGRLGYIMMYAELNGLICSGPLNGKQHTYALLDSRAPDARVLSPDEALVELTLRYFTSHGPATIKDFRWWSSLTVASIRRGLDLVGSRLQHEVVDGVPYWFAEPPPAAPPPAPRVHLLQGYDEYIVGYSESKYLLDVSGAARSLSTTRAVFNGVIILDRQVAGHWRRSLTKDSVVIDAALYAPLDKAQSRALQEAADRHGAFLGLPATVVPSEI